MDSISKIVLNKKIVIIILIIVLVFIAGTLFYLRNKFNNETIIPVNITPTLQPTVTLNDLSDIETIIEEEISTIPVAADNTYERLQEIQNKESLYPWINSLPLITSDYFVYFNTEDETFYGKLYFPSKAEISKRQAEAQLIQLKIPVEKYKIIWENE